MKEQGLLAGPFTELLPNFALVDVRAQPTTVVDFTGRPTGSRARGAWPSSSFHDTARVAEPPSSLAALLAWAEAHPGRFT